VRRALIAGGGTGGHFYPGLALARELGARGWKPVFLVRAGDAAVPKLEAEGLPWVDLDLHGLPRRLSPAALAFPWRLAKSLRRANAIMADLKPDAVIGMGGYLTFPAIAAAALHRVPRAVHESNGPLGLANRASVRLGARLFRGLPGPGGELTGTPIRRALWDIPADGRKARRELGLSEDKPTLLVFGGSQGAQSINRAVPAAAPGGQVLHLAGPRDQAEVQAAYAAAGVQASVLAYLDRMELAYAAADLVLCRSGASTLAELVCAKKPAILIPFPHASENHQEANARVLERAGAAKVVLDGRLEGLSGLLRDLLSSPQASSARAAMAGSYDRLALPKPAEAAAKLADAVENLAQEHTRR
jgi:UDP-N-acetylglucosamine--N-acetylmuramyl-(pentapeptide) pyrophosphoryl-undecaprenol N-acetylglucosamine transferase